MTSRLLWSIPMVVLLALSACGDDDEAPVTSTTTSTTAKRVSSTTSTTIDYGPGNPDVYKRIAAETDCDKLQAEFDTAMDNADGYPSGSDRRNTSLAYAEAADERMQDVDCY